MKKVLILGAHSRHAFKLGMLAEIIKTEILKDNEVKYLHCENTTGGYCALNKKHGKIYCKKCIIGSLKALEWNNFSKENIITMQKYEPPKFPKFKTLDELKNFTFEGINFGVAPTSSIMSFSRDYMVDPQKYQKDIEGFLRTEYIVLRNLEKVYEEFPFDELHTFNGRFAMPYSAVKFCEKRNIDYYLYEGGGDFQKYCKVKNCLIHNMSWLRELVKNNWEQANINDRDVIAKKWFEDRFAHIDKVPLRFVDRQVKNLLPKDFSRNVENIVIFNSSLDEYYAFDEYKNPIADNENIILKAILEKYKDDNSKHIYVRIHPNLAKAYRKKSNQIMQILEMEKQYKNNVTFIHANSKISTYDLMKKADKVITFISTVGVEAAYSGIPSILAGQAFYDELDCVYQAHNFEELFEYINNKNLAPKPKENAYPYGYAQKTFGINYKYYKPIKHNYGEFEGHNVRILENPISNLIKQIKYKFLSQ